MQIVMIFVDNLLAILAGFCEYQRHIKSNPAIFDFDFRSSTLPFNLFTYPFHSSHNEAYRFKRFSLRKKCQTC